MSRSTAPFAARMAARLPGAEFLGPNVIESEEQRVELIADLLDKGINPRAHRIFCVMEDRWGAPNYKGAARFTELYLEGLAALGFTVVQVVPPRTAAQNNGVAERNDVELLKNGVHRLRYLPPDTVEERLGLPLDFPGTVSSTLSRLAKGTLLQELIPHDNRRRVELDRIEGPPSLVLVENAYTLFPELSQRTADAARRGGPPATSFVYHPDRKNAERDHEARGGAAPLYLDGGRREVSPYEQLFAGIGDAPVLTISVESRQEFERVAAGVKDASDLPLSVPRFAVKPAGMPTVLHDGLDLSVDSTGLDLDDGRINVAYLGRLTAVKGPEEAVAAYRALLRAWEAGGNMYSSVNRPRLVMMGTGDLEENIRRDNADLIEPGDLVMAGAIDDTVKTEVLARSSVLLVTSGAHQESWHMASGEARAFGCLPVALGSIGGIRDGQRQGGGVEIETRDVNVYGAAVAELLSAMEGLPAPDRHTSAVRFVLENVEGGGAALRATAGRKAVLRGHVVEPSDSPFAARSSNARVLHDYVSLPAPERLGTAEQPWVVGARRMLDLVQFQPTRAIAAPSTGLV